jgi:hypothetical protein
VLIDHNIDDVTSSPQWITVGHCGDYPVLAHLAAGQEI